MHFQRFHFVDSALVALRAAEASFQKRLDQFPRERGPDHLSTQRKDIHVVVFNSLVGGEYVVNKSGPHTGKPYWRRWMHPRHCRRVLLRDPPCQRPRHWPEDHVIGVIVSRIQLMSAEVYDLVARASQQFRDLLFQNGVPHGPTQFLHAWCCLLEPVENMMSLLANVAKSVAEDDVRCSLPFTFEVGPNPARENEICAYKRGVRLDFKRFPMAFWMLALARQFGSPLLIGTCLATVFLPIRYHTVASRMFAFLCRGHKSSFCMKMPSLV